MATKAKTNTITIPSDDAENLRSAVQLESLLKAYKQAEETFNTRKEELSAKADEVRVDLGIDTTEAATNVSFRLPDGEHVIQFPKDRAMKEYSVIDFLLRVGARANEQGILSQEETEALALTASKLFNMLLLDEAIAVKASKVPTPYKEALEASVTNTTYTQMKPKLK